MTVQLFASRRYCGGTTGLHSAVTPSGWGVLGTPRGFGAWGPALCPRQDGSEWLRPCAQVTVFGSGCCLGRGSELRVLPPFVPHPQAAPERKQFSVH